eukprot:TRINITY_DN949_c0_g1_i1.p1 TRINITY_DN949_c0_g1~~TRINITY_DN949_c0_g1_i1.p1  ORF type:complete len:204 (+),score=34.27 TRINITY_DN949_c0_g1_i1:81-692(+)
MSTFTFEASTGDILLRENPADMSSTGSKVWPSSMVLTRYLQKNRSKFNFPGKRVLELGAGCGLPSLYLGTVGADCTMTDLNSVIYLLNSNTQLNSHLFNPHPVKVVEYGWGTDASFLNPPYDIVIGCDVVFKLDLIEPLISSLLQVTTSSSSIFISIEIRDPSVCNVFFQELEKHFQVSKIPKSRLDPIDKAEPVSVFSLKRL